MERHSVQTVPSALLLGVAGESSGRTQNSFFLGVGDPVYNLADPRWPGREKPQASGQLERLVGSDDELRASVRNWTAEADGSGSATRKLLEGREARRDNFLRNLDRGPAVIHLATHVLVSTTDREQGFVAFSLAAATPGGPVQPEYLQTTEIARLRVPGALVVMSGCATGSGDVRDGPGILGLTEAWLMAGAGAIISTGWPVEDNGGEFFGRFYHHLKTEPAAEALRRSQAEVAHSGNWRSAPGYWAAYQVTGGSH